MNTLTVYHIRTHTCSLKPQVAHNDDLITKVIEENAALRTTGIVAGKPVKEVQQQASINNVAQLAKKLDQKPRMKQLKQGILFFQHPETQSSEAVWRSKHPQIIITSLESTQ